MSQDFEQIESSQRQHHNEMEHNERMIACATQADYQLFSMLKPKVSKDGNQWCVLYGEDLQIGIAGFGDTIHKAILDFNGAFDRK